jgi:hypothetical protein
MNCESTPEPIQQPVAEVHHKPRRRPKGLLYKQKSGCCKPLERFGGRFAIGNTSHAEEVAFLDAHILCGCVKSLTQWRADFVDEILLLIGIA